MATEARIKNTVNNIIWIFFNVGVGSVFPFCIRYLIIRHFGIEYLGVSSFCSSLLQVLNITELGLGQALVFYMYKPAAENNLKEMNKLLSLYSKLYHFIGFVVMLLGLALLPVLPYMIKGDCPNGLNIYVVFVIYLTQSVISYFAFPCVGSAFSANQNLSVVSRIQGVIWFLIYSIQVLFINIEKFYFYILFLPVASFFSGLFSEFAMKRYFPDYKVSPLNFSSVPKSFLSELFRKVFAIALSKLRIVFRSTVDILIISSFFGLSYVAIYQNYNLTLSVPLMLTLTLSSAVLPSFGNGIALESKESNLAVIRLTTFVFHCVATVAGCFLICFMQEFMIVFAGKQNLLSEKCLFLFVIYFYFRVLVEIPILIRNASGIWWEGVWIPVLETIFNLFGNVIFARFLGIQGIILSSILSLFVINLPLETFYVYKYYFNTSPWNDMMHSLFDLIKGMIVIFTVYFLSRFLAEKISFSVVLRFAFVFVCSVLFFLLIHIGDKRVSDVINIVLSFVTRRNYGKE